MSRNHNRCRIRYAQVPDAYALDPILRPADLLDLQMPREEVGEHLAEGIRRGGKVMAIENPEGEVIGLFGITPMQQRFGAIWLLGSEEMITKHRWQFLRESRLWLEALSEGYAVIGNHVHEENRTHIEWLKWLGFAPLRRVIKNNEPFWEFAKVVNGHECVTGLQ